MAKKNRGRPRVKKSVLADVPKQEINWRDWSPQLILLVPLLEAPNIIGTFEQLRTSVRTFTGIDFDGTIASWKTVCASNEASQAIIRRENAAFFARSNLVVFDLFGFPSPRVDETASTAPKSDPVELILAFKRIEEPQSIASTSVKALHLLTLSHDEITQGYARSFLSGDADAAGHVRAMWTGLIGSYDLQPDVDWAATFYLWGMKKTACLIEEYESPDKPPWPITALEPVARAVEAILENVIGVSNAPVPERYTADVLTGLLARLRDLARSIREQSGRNEGMVTEITLRSLADTAVQIKYLLFKNDGELYEQFIERSHASQKGLLDDLRKRLDDAKIKSEAAEKLLRREYAGLKKRAGRWPELYDVVFGPWSDISTTTMFRQLPDTDEQLTFLTWVRASDTAHGSWRSLQRYQLAECQNPFHAGHHVARTDVSVTAGITPVLGSILIPLGTVAAYAERYPELTGLADSVLRQRQLVAEWIVTHQDGDGNFRWHGDD